MGWTEKARRRFSELRGAHSKIILFLLSQAVTLFGSSLVQYAMMWYVARVTDSGSMMALFTICGFLPQVLVSLFAGVWADRYDRRKLIMYADGGIAAATLILCIMMVLGYEGMAPIFIISAVRSVGAGIQTPAVSALIPQIVEEKQLMRVNSLNGTIQSFVMLVAPVAGAGLLAVGSMPVVLMIDVVTAAVGIGVMLALRIPPHERAERQVDTHPLEDLREGLRYAWQSFFIRRMTVYYLITSILIVPAAMFNVLFVTRSYGDSYLYLALNEAAFFIGSLVGGVVLAAWGGFKNRLKTLAAGCSVYGLATVFMGLVPPFWLYLVVMLLAGLTMPTFQSPVMVLMQEKVQGDMLGRIFSLMQIVSTLVMMVATALTGAAADMIPIAWIMLGAGALLLLLGGVFVLDRKFAQEGLPKAPSPQVEG
ncbi:MFS transporter [Oscillospiraceae bacterium OttesenSCG-928-F05]|nr:MFS transporter [Oscillospiraceae bacterium OttesenSCG-928-F05]